MLYIDKKYLNLLSLKLERFVQKNDSLYNFRCPICGDSKENEHKARGYVFEHKGSLFYKCHNCSASMPFSAFLKQEDPFLYSEYVLERFGKKFDKSKTPKIKKPVFKPKREKVPNYLIPLADLEDSHIAKQFVDARKIPHKHELYYIENVKLFEQTYSHYEGRLFNDSGRIVIPYRNNENKITGFTARALDGSSLRYINIKAGEFPMIWGMQNVNPKKTIFVTEGAFDAMFLNNAIAVSGSDLKKIDKYFDKSRTIFIFDNEPRNREICKKIETMINTNHVMFIPPKNLRGKDMNEMILNGMNPNELIEMINNNSYSDLEAKIKFTQWKKV